MPYVPGSGAQAPATPPPAPPPASSALVPYDRRELDAKRIQAAKDFYEVLGVSKTANNREIRVAYRNKSLLHHTNKGGSRAEFDKVQEAFNTLNDQAKRDAYDRRIGIKNGGRRTLNKRLNKKRRYTYRR